MLGSEGRRKNENVFVFFELDPSVLYRLAALPDELAATLTPETLLTGRQTALREMSARTLDRALDALEGKPTPVKPTPVKPTPAATVVVLSGATREEVAADAQRIMGLLSAQLGEMRQRKGSLTGASKQRVLAAIEQMRSIVLKWPAWATPKAK
jgi:hypothetical protein